MTSAPTATPPAVESDIEPGSTVINADSDANLRAGPSLDAEIVGTIPLGSELEVTGPAVAGDDALWWPVIVVATGEEGYVADELLIPAEARVAAGPRTNTEQPQPIWPGLHDVHAGVAYVIPGEVGRGMVRGL